MHKGDFVLAMMMMVALDASSVPIVPPPKTRKIASPIGALGVGSVLSSDDYPADALRNGEQGTVAVLLGIDTQGKVSGCVVTASSGSASLDDATCRLLYTRARFTPARNSQGRAVAGTSPQKIRWALPAPELPPRPLVEETSRLRFTVRGGHARDCVFTTDTGMIKSADCDRWSNLVRSAQSRLPAGVADPYRVVLGSRTRVGFTPPEPTAALASTFRTLADVYIGADGAVADCLLVPVPTLPGADQSSICDYWRERRFAPSSAPYAALTERHLFIEQTVEFEALR